MRNVVVKSLNTAEQQAQATVGAYLSKDFCPKQDKDLAKAVAKEMLVMRNS